MYLYPHIFNLTRTISNATSVIGLAIFMTLIGNNAFAQSSSSSVFGTLTNEQEDPVSFATMGLFRTDSTFVKGEVSDDNGHFEFSNLESGNYYIEIHSVELARHSQFVTLKNGERLNLGRLQPLSSSLSLDEVLVTAERQMIEVRPDRMIFNVDGNVSAQGINTLELLNQAPGIMIDPDNNILLQGKSGVRVYINGRPSRLSGDDLAIFLESMQSDNIERVELITNPSAKYEAEGNAGIIDIRLKNNVTLGYNGTLVNNTSFGREPRMANGVTMNYGKGKVGLTANVTRFDNQFSLLVDDFKGLSGNEISLEAEDIKKRFGYNFNTSLTYTMNKKHSVNLSVGGVAPDGDNTYTSQAIIDNIADTADDQLLLSESNKKYEARTMNYGMNYIWNVKENTTLSTDISYGTYGLDQNLYQPNIYYTLDGMEFKQSNNAFEHGTKINIYSIKADLDKKFKKLSVSGGFKYYEVDIKNDFRFKNFDNGTESLVESVNSKFSYTEKVGALYVMSDYQIAKNLNASLGTRIEQTSSRGILETIQTLDDKDVPRHYTNVFPSMSISYTSNDSEFMASYGRRLTRPTYKHLNPFENKLNDLTVRKGNPFLKPNYISNYQVSFSYKKNLIISNTYSIIDGYFANLSEAVDETTTQIIPRNMNRSTTNGLSLSYLYEVTDFWESNIFLIYNRSTYESQFDESRIDITANMSDIQIQNKINLPKDFTMSLNYSYSSAYIWRGFMEVEGYHWFDLGLRRGFFEDNLQMRLTARDVLGKGGIINYNGVYGGIDTHGVINFDSQRFQFGLTYKFGNNDIKKKSRKGGLSSELNRI